MGSQPGSAVPAPCSFRAVHIQRVHCHKQHQMVAAQSEELRTPSFKNISTWQHAPQHFLSLLPQPGWFSSHLPFLPTRHAWVWKHEQLGFLSVLLSTVIPFHKRCLGRVASDTHSSRPGDVVLKHLILPLPFYLRDTFISQIYKLDKA